jgi:hypothetical protein
MRDYKLEVSLDGKQHEPVPISEYDEGALRVIADILRGPAASIIAIEEPVTAKDLLDRIEIELLIRSWGES